MSSEITAILINCSNELTCLLLLFLVVREDSFIVKTESLFKVFSPLNIFLSEIECFILNNVLLAAHCKIVRGSHSKVLVVLWVVIEFLEFNEGASRQSFHSMTDRLRGFEFSVIVQFFFDEFAALLFCPGYNLNFWRFLFLFYFFFFHLFLFLYLLRSLVDEDFFSVFYTTRPRQIFMSDWDWSIVLELLVHLSDNREKVGVPTIPFLKRISDVHVCFRINLSVNDMVHNMNCRRLRRKSVGNTHFDEKWSSRAREDKRNTKIFFVLGACNNCYVLVVAIELSYLILAHLCMGTNSRVHCTLLSVMILHEALWLSLLLWIHLWLRAIELLLGELWWHHHLLALPCSSWSLNIMWLTWLEVPHWHLLWIRHIWGHVWSRWLLIGLHFKYKFDNIPKFYNYNQE